jgi:hypothetical protein
MPCFYNSTIRMTSGLWRFDHTTTHIKHKYLYCHLLSTSAAHVHFNRKCPCFENILLVQQSSASQGHVTDHTQWSCSLFTSRWRNSWALGTKENRNYSGAIPYSEESTQTRTNRKRCFRQGEFQEFSKYHKFLSRHWSKGSKWMRMSR